MKDGIPTLPSGHSPKFFFLRSVWFMLWGGRFPIRGVGGAKVEWNNGWYEVTAAPGGRAGSSGGYMGDYDNTKSYESGQTVRILAASNIGGITTTPGLYGVPPGVSVPANGTGFQVPQSPEPASFGAAPNDKVYWHFLTGSGSTGQSVWI